MEVPFAILQGEADHGLIDGADLLDIEGAVGEALAVEEQELFQDAEEGAVGDERELVGWVAHVGAGAGAAFEEGEAVRVEEVPLARRHFQLGRAGSPRRRDGRE